MGKFNKQNAAKDNVSNKLRVTFTAPNIGFGVIGAGRCYLHLQQHGVSCSGRTFFNLAFSC